MAKTTDAKDLRMQTEEELGEFIRGKQDELLKLRFQKATGQLENIRRVNEAKRELARALTVKNEKAKAQAAAK